MNWKLARFLFCSTGVFLDVYFGILAKHVLKDSELARLFFWSAALFAVGVVTSYFTLDPDDRK